MLKSVSDQPTRASLLVRLRDHGDHEAWCEFERRYGDLILGYARRSGLQAADAEDVRQVVLASLARSFGSFHYDPGRGRFRHYLRRTVRHAIDGFKQRHARGPGPLWTDGVLRPPGGADDEHDEVWEREWMQHHYRLALREVRGSLDPGSLEVFEMLLAGSPTVAVAAALGTTEAAVRKVKQRVRDRLRDKIAAQIAEEQADG